MGMGNQGMLLNNMQVSFWFPEVLLLEWLLGNIN